MIRYNAIRQAAALLICLAAPVQAGKKSDPPLVDLSVYFEKMLKTMPIPTAEKIRQMGLHRTFPRADFDAVWDSLVKVIIQNGIIVHADKSAGLLISMSDLVTRGPGESQYDPNQETTPLCNTIYVLADREDATGTTVYLKADKPLNRAFFDLFASHLYAHERFMKLERLPPRR
jgi:hypothetical protein